MRIKTVYSYDSTTKEYAGETFARESPLELGVFHIPACATDIAPPTAGERQAVVFDENLGEWTLKPDYRSHVYYDTETQEQKSITEIGVEPTTDWTDIAPTDAEAVWNGQKWKIPFLTLKSRKKAEIAAARWQAETGGIQTGGLTIATDRESQSLINAAVTSTILDPTYTVRWKMTDGWVDLDAPMIQTVAQAVRNHVQACFDREARIDAAIEAIDIPSVTGYEEALKTITWEE